MSNDGVHFSKLVAKQRAAREARDAIQRNKGNEDVRFVALSDQLERVLANQSKILGKLVTLCGEGED